MLTIIISLLLFFLSFFSSFFSSFFKYIIIIIIIILNIIIYKYNKTMKPLHFGHIEELLLTRLSSPVHLCVLASPFQALSFFMFCMSFRVVNVPNRFRMCSFRCLLLGRNLSNACISCRCSLLRRRDDG